MRGVRRAHGCKKVLNSARDSDHEPVLYIEVLDHLLIRRGGVYIDATLGSAGHATGILQRSSPNGRLLGLDADPDALVVAGRRLMDFGDRAVLEHSNFSRMAEAAGRCGFAAVDGILMDLGLSSRQLSARGRGFAFQEDAPLDMRLDPAQPDTAYDLVNTATERDLADVIYKLGDEPASRRIARSIVAARPVSTTGQLAALIERCVGHRGKIHPATKTFLALRRWVNAEDDSLAQALPQAVSLLKPGGRLAIIAFHGGEDSIVKAFLRQESRDCICDPALPQCQCSHKATVRLITRHVVTGTEDERQRNPRSRSARLRVAERL